MVRFASAAGRQVSGSLPKATLLVQQNNNVSLNLPSHSARCKARGGAVGRGGTVPEERVQRED